MTKPPFDFKAMEDKAKRMSDAELEGAIADIDLTLETWKKSSGQFHPNDGWYSDERHTYIKEQNRRKG